MGKMIKMTALSLPFVLSSCAATSVKGMRENEPVLVTDSTRDVTAISNCVSAAWIDRKFTPSQIPRENGTTLLVQQMVTYALPLILVDLDTTPTGSHVTMRLFKTIWSKQNQARIDEVRACL